MTQSSDPSALKKAASLLLKGGTLTSEQCENCGGALVRFENAMICINCGRKSPDAQDTAGEVRVGKNEKNRGATSPETARPSTDISGSRLGETHQAIEEKIQALAKELRDERDFLVQDKKVALLERYLSILEKIRQLA